MAASAVGVVDLPPVERDGQTYLYDVNTLSNFVTDAPTLIGFDPFDMGDLRPADSVRAARLHPSDETAVLGGNALRVYAGLDPAAWDGPLGDGVRFIVGVAANGIHPGLLDVRRELAC